MYNNHSALNNYLFEQIERLNDPELKGDELAQECKRAQAINETAGQIVKNASLSLEAHKLMSEGRLEHMPKMLEG